MFHIGPGLIADFAVIDSAQRCEPLRTSRQPFSFVARSTAIMQLAKCGKQAAVVVPVAIVLVPFPSAAGPRLLENHLVMIVIHFAAEEPLHRIDNAAAADEGARDVVAERRFGRQADRTPLTIAPAGGKLIVGMPRAGDFSEQIDFRGVEQPIDEKKPVFMEPANLVDR